jgi:hypothetical protein
MTCYFLKLMCCKKKILKILPKKNENTNLTLENK